MNSIRFLDDPAFLHLRNNDVEGFKKEIARRGKVVLENANLRDVDFHTIPLEHLFLKACYLRDADLRGCDIRHWDLEGSSIHNARIGGTYFPEDVEPDELRLSHTHGIRIRASLNHRVVVGAARKKGEDAS